MKLSTCFVTLILLQALILLLSLASQVKAVANIDILSYTGYIDSFGYYHVVGEVQNVGDQALNFVEIEAIFFDSNDVIIATRFDLTMLDVLLVGRKSPFDISLLDTTESANVDHYSLSTTFSTTSPIAIGLEILSQSSHVDEVGCLHIIGQIKNVASEKASNVKVIGTFYNQAGDVVAATLTHLDPEAPSDIDPGQTKPFEILLSEERTRHVATYELTAESTQYAIISEFPILTSILLSFLALTIATWSSAKSPSQEESRSP